MAVEVKVPSLLQKLVGDSKVVKGEGETVGQLINNLDARYPGFKSRLIAEDGKVHRFVNIYLNDEDIRFLSELETRVKDGDAISILPAVAGGSVWLGAPLTPVQI